MMCLICAGEEVGIASLYPFTLEPNEMKRISYNIVGDHLRYEFIATDQVKLYLVDDNGLNDIRNNVTFFKYHNTVVLGRYIREEIKVPHAGDWHFLIYNFNSIQVNFNYEISEGW